MTNLKFFMLYIEHLHNFCRSLSHISYARAVINSTYNIHVNGSWHTSNYKKGLDDMMKLSFPDVEMKENK